MMNLGPSGWATLGPSPRRDPLSVLSLRLSRSGGRMVVRSHHSAATYLIRNQTTTKREQQCIGEFFVKILKQGVVKVGRIVDFLDF